VHRFHLETFSTTQGNKLRCGQWLSADRCMLEMKKVNIEHVLANIHLDPFIKVQSNSFFFNQVGSNWIIFYLLYSLLFFDNSSKLLVFKYESNSNVPKDFNVFLLLSVLCHDQHNPTCTNSMTSLYNKVQTW
jgi:hypothetical protein